MPINNKPLLNHMLNHIYVVIWHHLATWSLLAYYLIMHPKHSAYLIQMTNTSISKLNGHMHIPYIKLYPWKNAVLISISDNSWMLSVFAYMRSWAFWSPLVEVMVWCQMALSHYLNQWWLMMTSSNGNVFCVIGHLCVEFTGYRWIPRTKASDTELWCFLRSAPE